MKIKKVNISSLKPHPQNPNQHPQEQLNELESSLEQFDQVKNIVVWKNLVIAGNGLLMAAEKQGRKEIEVRDVSDWPEEKAIKFMIADNRLPELTIMDDEILAGLLKDLGDPLDVPGIDEAFLDELGFEDEAGGEGGTDQDEVPENIESVVKNGELWLLGNHRLFCGDATKKEDVERLMDGENAELCFTDPPYGVNYDGGVMSKRKKLKKDSTTDLYKPCCQMAMDFTIKDAPLYLWHAGVKGISAAAAAAAAGWQIRSEIIWNKNQVQYGALSAHYKQKHEPCYYCFKKGNSDRWVGPTTEITVWDIDRASKNEYHPTQKPVELAERAIRNHDCNIILDLFGGSGSTLIACERNNKKCRMMELDETYCTVILQRYLDFTGKDPIREDGMKFSEFKNK